MNEHRIEIDLGDGIGVIRSKASEPHHQISQRVDVRRGRATMGIE